MGTRFRPYQPKQLLMLPPDLREWVPEGHLAHQVSELNERDLRELGNRGVDSWWSIRRKRS